MNPRIFEIINLNLPGGAELGFHLRIAHEIISCTFKQPPSDDLFQGSQNHLPDHINVHVLSNHALFLPLFDDFQDLARRLSKGIVGLRLDKAAVYPPFEQKDLSLFRIRFEKVEIVPYEFPDFIESSCDPLEV